MKRPLLSLFVILAALSTVAHAQDQTRLTCAGSGSIRDTQQSTSIELDKEAKTTVTNTNTRRPFTGVVTVELAGSSIRLQLPHDMVPGLNRATDGWFTADEPFVGDQAITGVVALNMFNKPKLKIDRMTGVLTLSSGFSDFSGTCSKVDAQSGPKF